MSPVSDHLVHVHIALRARPCLPDDQRELIVVPPLEDLIAHLCNRIALLFRQLTQLMVGIGGTLLQVCKAMDDLRGHRCRRPDSEVVA